jgi:hypothetical protein
LEEHLPSKQDVAGSSPVSRSISPAPSHPSRRASNAPPPRKLCGVHWRFARPLRNSDGPVLFESFFIAAVVSFLGIRAFLVLTGFPRIGRGELHVAHMLWGGALMLIALLLLLAYLDRPIQHVAAVVAGLGFGTFVDEIGKFVTADNDYFYRPAIALIYVVFVAVFLAARALAGRQRLTEREALANAIDLIETTIGRDLEPEDRARVQGLLSSVRHPYRGLVADMTRYLNSVPGRPDDVPWFEAIPRAFAAMYERVARHPAFVRALTVAVIAYTVSSVAGSAIVIASVAAPVSSQPLTVSAVGQVASTLTGAGLVALGVVALPTSRVTAYRWFTRGALVWILVTQVFVFYDSQLAGLIGLAVNLIVYSALRFAAQTEKASPRARQAAASGAPPSRP